MKLPSPVKRRHSRIEIIPLIDIMFFLLASFMMVSADHHEGGQQKEHNVNQRNDLDPGVPAFDWRGQLHFLWPGSTGEPVRRLASNLSVSSSMSFGAIIISTLVAAASNSN